mgnify:CR=1 FL=1
MHLDAVHEEQLQGQAHYSRSTFVGTSKHSIQDSWKWLGPQPHVRWNWCQLHLKCQTASELYQTMRWANIWETLSFKAGPKPKKTNGKYVGILVVLKLLKLKGKIDIVCQRSANSRVNGLEGTSSNAWIPPWHHRVDSPAWVVSLVAKTQQRHQGISCWANNTTPKPNKSELLMTTSKLDSWERCSESSRHF